MSSKPKSLLDGELSPISPVCLGSQKRRLCNLDDTPSSRSRKGTTAEAKTNAGQRTLAMPETGRMTIQCQPPPAPPLDSTAKSQTARPAHQQPAWAAATSGCPAEAKQSASGVIDNPLAPRFSLCERPPAMFGWACQLSIFSYLCGRVGWLVRVTPGRSGSSVGRAVD